MLDRAAAARRECARLQENLKRQKAGQGDIIEPGYYVTVRDAGRVGFLAGPYPSKRAAECKVDAARDKAHEADPWSWFYAFGVSRVLKPIALRRGGVSFGVL